MRTGAAQAHACFVDDLARARTITDTATEIRERAESSGVLDIPGDASRAVRQILAAVRQVEESYYATRRSSDAGPGHTPDEVSGALWTFETVVQQATRELDGILASIRARHLNNVLMSAISVPPGTQLRNVGKYRALEFISHGPGIYWATVDLVDKSGSGHLEITVGRSSVRPPLSVEDLARQPGSCSQKELDNGIIIRQFTAPANPLGQSVPGVVAVHRIIAIRPDGSYVDTHSTNQDSLSRDTTRPDPPLSIDALVKIATLPDLVP